MIVDTMVGGDREPGLKLHQSPARASERLPLGTLDVHFDEIDLVQTAGRDKKVDGGQGMLTDGAESGPKTVETAVSPLQQSRRCASRF